MFPVAMKSNPRHLPYVHRLQLTLNRFFASPALVVVLATGIYQMAEGNWEWGDLWVSATLGDRVHHRRDQRRLLRAHRPQAAADGRARHRGFRGTVR